MRDIKSIIIGALAIASFTCVGIRAFDDYVSANNNTPAQKQTTQVAKAPTTKDVKRETKEVPKKEEPAKEVAKEAKENTQCSYCRNHKNAYDYGYNVASDSYDYLSRFELMDLADDMGVGTCSSCRDNCRMGINDYCNTRDKLEAEKVKINNEKKICSVCQHPYSDYGCSEDICLSPDAKGMN